MRRVCRARPRRRTRCFAIRRVADAEVRCRLDRRRAASGTHLSPYRGMAKVRSIYFLARRKREGTRRATEIFSVYTNNAEEFFSRMRRAEIGHHHHVADPYLVRYAQEAAWREDHRRTDNSRQVQGVMG
ncbi:MAG: transposase, partial [Acetobacteraceae bacterium]